MANLTELSQWENVIRQIENGEAATGGADGLANIQAKQLANRTKYLKDNYLPLSGGVMSGSIRNKNNNTKLSLLGATNTEDGAYLGLHGVDNADYPGWFVLGAGKYAVDNSHAQFIGKPDGSLLWNKNDLAGSAIVAKSLNANGYVKYASGMIIQWGTVSVTDATDKKNVSPVYYPIEFPNGILSMSAMSITDDLNQDFTSYITRQTKSNFGFGIRGTFVSQKVVSISWLAIGY